MKTTNSSKSSNRILLNTLKTVSQRQEAWGDSVTHEVQIATDMADGAEKNARLYAALRKLYPFNPTFCTNQIRSVDAVGTTVRFVLYHSIGD